MSKKLLMIGLAAGLCYDANAQLPLPYECGFDTPAEIDNWTIYRKGYSGTEGSPSHSWEPYEAPGAISSPNTLFHDYAVGYGGTEQTDDWLVSDKLSLSGGGLLDMNIWVFSMSGTPEAGDGIELYLLKGNRDPAIATKVLLGSFKHLASNVGSALNPAWTDTADIDIPAASGDAYIGFRYTTTWNWFTTAIDEIKITAKGTTALEPVAKMADKPVVFPNPAKDWIYWKADDLKGMQGMLINASGQEILRFDAGSGKLDLHNLRTGLYLLRLGTLNQTFIRI